MHIRPFGNISVIQLPCLRLLITELEFVLLMIVDNVDCLPEDALQIIR